MDVWNDIYIYREYQLLMIMTTLPWYRWLFRCSWIASWLREWINAIAKLICLRFILCPSPPFVSRYLFNWRDTQIKDSQFKATIFFGLFRRKTKFDKALENNNLITNLESFFQNFLKLRKIENLIDKRWKYAYNNWSIVVVEKCRAKLYFNI